MVGAENTKIGEDLKEDAVTRYWVLVPRYWVLVLVYCSLLTPRYLCSMEIHPIILFDGVCNYCNSMVNFIIRQDKEKIFRFAPLQSEAGQKIIEQFNLPSKNFDSFILVENDKIYFRSDAALRLYNLLPVTWKWTQVFWSIPPFIRDGVYNLIAKNRYKWFGKKDECMVPTPEVRERFLN